MCWCTLWSLISTVSLYWHSLKPQNIACLNALMMANPSTVLKMKTIRFEKPRLSAASGTDTFSRSTTRSMSNGVAPPSTLKSGAPATRGGGTATLTGPGAWARLGHNTSNSSFSFCKFRASGESASNFCEMWAGHPGTPPLKVNKFRTGGGWVFSGVGRLFGGDDGRSSQCLKTSFCTLSITEAWDFRNMP